MTKEVPSPTKVPSSSKPLIIPIFIPHAGCPHRCVFCNQSTITQTADKMLPSLRKIRDEVERFLQYKGTRTKVELAFFGGNFLGLAPPRRHPLLETAAILANEKKIDGFRFSTRPDTITETIPNLLAPYPVTAVEVGVQSMSDAVLKKARRGHSAQDTRQAAAILKEVNCAVGMQMMVGLPGDTEESALKTAQEIASLSPDFVRIYPLIVLEGSPLAAWYRKGSYQPLSLEETVRMVTKIYRIFDLFGIEVIRMGLQASDLMQDETIMLAGPWHPAFGHLVYSELFFDTATADIHRLIKQNAYPPPPLKVIVHPASISRFYGDHKINLKRIKKQFPSVSLEVETDSHLDKKEMIVMMAHEMNHRIIDR